MPFDFSSSITFKAVLLTLFQIKRKVTQPFFISWNLFKDTSDPGRYLETFIVESWIEHLRQHERVTLADHNLLDQALAFHIGDKPPLVSHSVAERLPKHEKEN